jgi:hypothetical protein
MIRNTNIYFTPQNFYLTFGDSSTYRGGRTFTFSASEGSESESSKKLNKTGNNGRSRQIKFFDEELYAYEEVLLPLVAPSVSADVTRPTEIPEDEPVMTKTPDFSDVIEAIQASNSRDGPPSKRICKYLQFRVIFLWS